MCRPPPPISQQGTIIFGTNIFSGVPDEAGALNCLLGAGVRELSAAGLDSRLLIAVGVCYCHLSSWGPVVSETVKEVIMSLETRIKQSETKVKP